MRRLAVLAAAAATLVLAATPGQAAPFSYADPKADTLVDNPGLDLLSVSYGTIGARPNGRYVPVHLVATVTLAGPVVQQPGVTYHLYAASSTCGELTLTYSSGTVYGRTNAEGRMQLRCSYSVTLPAEMTVAGSRLTFKVPLGELPAAFTQGAVTLSDFRATTEVRDPVFAVASPHQFTDVLGVPAAVDVATSKARWRLA